MCESPEALVGTFKKMYPPDVRVRHWIIIAKESRSAFVQPNVSTGLNSFLLADLTKDGEKVIEKFAKDRLQVISCLQFDPDEKIITCESAERLLFAFKAMYPPEESIRHWIIFATEKPAVLIQPNVSTGLNSFLLKSISDKDEETIREFAGDKIQCIECPTFDLFKD
ncbi:MAG: hypothetical protein ACE5J0_00880 [Candidatus Paceibacterales bacterium]